MSTTQIVVVGGGYAGCMAANRLRRKTDPAAATITLINARPDFVERVRLHQRIAGTGEAAAPLTEMLNDDIGLIVGTVTGIGDGELSLDDGSRVAFDRLIYAAGGAARGPEGTLAVGDPEQASLARTTLATLPGGARVTVVGGGLTGIETAAEIAEARRDLHLTLLSDEVAASLHPNAARRVRGELARLGVAIERGRYPQTGPGSAGAPADLVLWAIATDVSDLAARSGLTVNTEGRVVVDEFLRSVSDPRIFAAGDGAGIIRPAHGVHAERSRSVPGAPEPGQRLSCQTALPQGAHVADNLARELAGEALTPYSMGYTGENVSLGRRRAVIQSARRDATPTRIWFGGRTGAFVKERICAMAKSVAGSGRYAWLPAPAQRSEREAPVPR